MEVRIVVHSKPQLFSNYVKQCQIFVALTWFQLLYGLHTAPLKNILKLHNARIV